MPETSAIVVEQSLFSGNPKILTLAAGDNGRILTADPRRWSLSFYMTDALAAGQNIQVWPKRLTANGFGIIIPSGGITFKLDIHGAIVSGEWWCWSGGVTNLAVVPAIWGG